MNPDEVFVYLDAAARGAVRDPGRTNGVGGCCVHADRNARDGDMDVA